MATPTINLTIRMKEREHRLLKAAAALDGVSISQFVMSRVIADAEALLAAGAPDEPEPEPEPLLPVRKPQPPTPAATPIASAAFMPARLIDDNDPGRGLMPFERVHEIGRQANELKEAGKNWYQVAAEMTARGWRNSRGNVYTAATIHGAVDSYLRNLASK